MPRVDIVRESRIKRSVRVKQLEGLFDIAPSRKSGERWSVDFDLPEDWNIGLIVGPSGSGKSTVARCLFRDSLVERWAWPKDQSVLDGFSESLGVKEIVAMLSSVGFSSPPSWLRPYDVLSNGERFRVDMARTLAECPDMAVVDEFTSVVDRRVAKIGSCAIAKTVRKRNQKFVAVSCHYDIAEWLQPDWVYEPHVNRFARDCLQRPKIKLQIERVHHSAWRIFSKHHYLSSALNPGAICFGAFFEGDLCAFSAWLHFLHAKRRNVKREHRTVTLPEYQGVGIGNALSDCVASYWKARGFGAISTTSHPAMIAARMKSPNWKCTRAPSFSGGKGPGMDKLSRSRATRRLTAGFEYIGPPMRIK